MAFVPSSSAKGKPLIVQNPDEEEAFRALWQSKILIPFSLGPLSRAFL
ncbi:hypothetical protein A2U01_0036322 [Trifolium medium]|uniref:Uncharacterized protein n=1 Tax=Trifolium medium TaxID=97028 RepID=A0A392PV45_9FABA|nr:hypothetical protein [Trifolium medium]